MGNRRIAIMIVEGDTDLLLVSLLLEKWLGFKFHQKGPFSPNYDNYAWYYNNTFELLIYNSQGISNLNKCFDLLMPQIKSNDEVEKTIIMIDRDDKTDEEILRLVNFEDIKFVINSEKENTLDTELGDSKSLYTYLKVIPSEKNGALETIVLDSLKNDELDIVSSVDEFVCRLNPKAKKHLSKKRYELKAKLAISYVLIDPLNAFCELKKRFYKVDVDNKTIEENFSFLKEILK